MTGDAVGERKISFPSFPEPRRRASAASLNNAWSRADPSRMELASLNFAVWWYATLAVFGFATWFAARSRVQASFERVGLVFLFGIAAGLVMYLAPRGIASMHSPHDLQLRFFCALGISWLVAMRAMPAGAGPAGYSSLALAGFAGVNAPLLAFVASSFMVCGGQAGCSL
jgi:hypothetical protein